MGLLSLAAIACGGERAAPPATAAVPTEYAYVTNEDSHDMALFRVGPEAGRPARDQVGLFHVAWQVDRPEDLEALHAHLRAKGVPISATTDHGANLSVYFEDPDGNQLELTYERPRAEWPAGQNPFAGRAPLPFAAGGR